MYLRYHAGRSFRHATTAMLEAALVVAIGAALVFGFAAATGGNPAGAGGVSAASAPTGTISLGISTARAAALKFGSSVAFDTSVKGRLAPKSDVYVTVVCKQGTTVVYQWSGDPSFTFPLKQQDGLKALGYIWDPAQDATCSGTLVYRDDGGRTPTIIFLDKVGFGTVGS